MLYPEHPIRRIKWALLVIFTGDCALLVITNPITRGAIRQKPPIFSLVRDQVSQNPKIVKILVQKGRFLLRNLIGRICWIFPPDPFLFLFSFLKPFLFEHPDKPPSLQGIRFPLQARKSYFKFCYALFLQSIISGG